MKGGRQKAVQAVLHLMQSIFASLRRQDRKDRRNSLKWQKVAAAEERKQQLYIEQINKKKEDISQRGEEIKNAVDKETAAVQHQLDLQMQAIQRSTKTSFKALAPVHNYLRTKSKLYYVWHLNPYSSTLHFGALLFFIGVSIYFVQTLYPALYQKALADSLTCTWTGAVDTNWDTPGNWANSGYCDGSTKIPGSAQNIAFAATTGAKADLVMTSNKTITAINSPSGFDKTFNTNNYSLTVNGVFSWLAGTLTAGASEITINSGDLTITGGTFNYNTSNIILTGSASNINSDKTFYNIIINKSTSDTAVTVTTNSFHMNNNSIGMKVFKGRLNRSGSEIVYLDGYSNYTVGAESTGGNATLRYTGNDTAALSGSGGTAVDNIELNFVSSAASLIVTGDVKFKNVTINTGTFWTRDGVITFDSDDANYKVTCNGSNVIKMYSTSINLVIKSSIAGDDWHLESGTCTTTGNDNVIISDTHNTGPAITLSNGIDGGGNTGITVTNGYTKKRWVGGQSGHENDWSWAANWEGGVAPSGSDMAYFDSSSSVNVSLSASTGSSNMKIINATYTGTLSTSDNTLTAGTLIWGGGGINFGNSTVNLSTLTNIKSATITNGNSTINVSGSNASFAASGTASFYNMAFSCTSSSGAGGDFTITHTLTLTSNSMYGDINSAVNLSGDLVTSGTNTGPFINWTKTADETITGSGTLPPIKFNNNRTVTLGGNLSITGLKISQGTLDSSANNYNVTVGTSGFANISTFNARSGTLTFNANSTWIPGSGNYNNVTFGTGSNIAINTKGTATISGALTLNFGASGTGGMYNGTINLTSNNLIGTSGSSTYTGTATIINWTAAPTSWNPGAASYPIVKFNTSGVTTTLAGNLDAVCVEIASGVLNASSYNISVDSYPYYDGGPGFSVSATAANSFVPGTGTLIFLNPGSGGPVDWSQSNSAAATYYNVTLQDPLGARYLSSGVTYTVTNNFVMSGTTAQGLNNGTINVGGNLTFSQGVTSGSTAFVLNGAGSQTVTLPSGTDTIPGTTLTINKPSGKAVFTTAAGTGNITNNIDLQAGTLEFAPGAASDNTFTITAGKTITTAAGTILRYAGNSSYKPVLVSGTPGTRWNIADSGNVYANYVDVTDSNNSAGTIYAMNSTVSNCIGWDTTSTAKTWDGGASTTIWNDANNWNPDGVPDANDTVTLDVASTITTSANINFGILTVGGTNATTLKFANNITSGGDITITSDGTIEQSNAVEQTIGGDLTINGTSDHLANLTHTANGTTAQGEMYKVIFKLGNSMSVGTYGKVDVAGKGYAVNNGPGKASDGSSGASYGGRGQIWSSSPGPTYGSAINPTNIGSSMTFKGGGAAIFSTAGSGQLDGVITANAENSGSNGSGGSGGSVNINSSTIAGVGSITANGTSSYYYGQGGGGRIAIVANNGSDFGSVSSTAYGGCESGPVCDASKSYYGYAGTIYKKTAGQINGDIYVNHNNIGKENPASVKVNTMPYATINGESDTGSYTFDHIYLQNLGKLKVVSGQALNIADNQVTGTSSTLWNDDYGSDERLINEGTVKMSSSAAIDGFILANNGTIQDSGGNVMPAFSTLSLNNYGVYYNCVGKTLDITNTTVNIGTAGAAIFNAGTTKVPANWLIGNYSFVQQNGTITDASGGNTYNLTIASGGILTHWRNISSEVYTLNLSINGGVDIQANGSIDAMGKGPYNTGGLGFKSNGASHGGKGSQWIPGGGFVTVGDTYDSVDNPVHIGSTSNGPASPTKYLSGGGAVLLTITGQINIDGKISADSSDPHLWTNGSTGSGGSVNITAGTVTGSGSISASSAQGQYYAPGGGGRVAVKLTSGNDFGSIQMAAYGGYVVDDWSGAAGTIYTKTSSQQYGSVLIDNHNRTNVGFGDAKVNTTLFGDGANCDAACQSKSTTFDSITIQNKGKLQLVGTQNITTTGDVTVAASSELQYASDNDGTPANGAWPTVNVGGNLSVSGSITSDGLGFAYNTGAGAGGTGTNNGGGGGFGGAGGASSDGGTGGSTYGANQDIAYIGSGGGSAQGGSGGGHIELNVTGNTILATTGIISANGNAGTTSGSVNGGGGSGGAIFIKTTGNLTVPSGSYIRANGGNGIASQSGGGGGGRIFIITAGTRTISGTLQALGAATGSSPGSNGTVCNQASPTIPTISSPSNGAVNQSQVIGIHFSTTDGDGDYLRYKVELADDNQFSQNLHTFTQDAGSQTYTDNSLTAIYSGQDSQSGTAYTSGTAAVLTIDSSTPLVQNHTYYLRISAIDPGGVDSYDGSPHYGPATAAYSFTVAPLDKLVFISGAAQTITAHTSCSAVLTFETRNYLNETVVLQSGRQDTNTFTLSDGDQNGSFYTSADCSGSAVTQTTISYGSSSASVYYKNSHSNIAAYTITVAESPDSSWTDATTTMQVNPYLLDHFTVTGYPASRTTDQYFPDPIVVTAYDIYNNVKFDYYGTNAQIWFTTTTDSFAYSPDLPAKVSSKYQFVSGDAGSHSFAGSTFRLKQVGSHTVTFHNDTYDGLSDRTMTSSTITVTPGEAFSFVLENYPNSTPDWSRYVVSGSTWDLGGTGAPYKPKVTVKDQFGNIKTDYIDRKVWFELYTSINPDVAAIYSFTNSTEGTAYAFTSGDAGVHAFDSTAFMSETSGRNLILRVRNETIHNDFLIYIKPLGLDHFAISTSQILSKDGTNYDQAVDNQLKHEASDVTVTVTAYDVLGYVKTDYAANESTGYGYIYFWSPGRSSDDGAGQFYTNQEFPYYRDSKDAVDTTHCMAFPAEAAGVYTFTSQEAFKFFNGGRRQIYASECVSSTSSYAVDNQLNDEHITGTWPGNNLVKVGLFPTPITPDTVAVTTHVPGSTHTLDSHTDNANNNFTIGPGDQKLTLSWQNPFDVPSGSDAKIHIYQSTDGTNYTELVSPRPSVNGASMWQTQDVSGLSNEQTYYFKLKLGYKRSDTTEILSDFSIVQSGVPKAIAPVDVTAVQLDRTDPDYPGQVKIDYQLRFESTTTFSYFNPANLSWNNISDAVISGDKGVLSGDFNNPVSHTTYVEMNSDFEGQYLATSFKVRVNVDVVDQGQSNSESPTMRLDTKNPASVSLVIDATNNTIANLAISAVDDSTPMQMMVSKNADYSGSSWEAYAASKTNFDITDATHVYITFRDMYYNDTAISTEIRPVPANLQIKDASNLTTSKYRLVLIWDDAANVDHYNIWRSTDNLNYQKIDTTTKNGYLDINLSSDNTYAYKITSEDVNHNISLPAGPVSSKPGAAPDVTAEPQVELFGWRQDQGVRVKITWDTDQLADSNVAYSKGEINSGSDMTTKTGESVQIAANPELTYNHEIWIYNLEPSTKYFFKAFSKNEIQIAGYSQVLDFTTPERVPLLMQGMEISNITVNSAVANWSTSKLATTILEYSDSAISGDSTPAGTVREVDQNMNTDHTFMLKNLNSGTKYYLRAKVTDADGNTTTSDIYTFSTFALPQISNVSISDVSYNSAVVSWTTNVETDSTVEYSTKELKNQRTEEQGTLSSSSPTSPTASRDSAQSATQGRSEMSKEHSVNLIGLDSATTYTCRVISRDRFANFAQSETRSFTTSSDITAPLISNLKAEVASTGAGDTIKYQAIISWDTDEPATSQIEFAMGIGGDYTDKTEEILSLNASHVVILPDLKVNSAYHFRIVSKDKVGNLSYSDDISLITPPKEKSLLQVVLKSLEDTFSWVGRLRSKWLGQ